MRQYPIIFEYRGKQQFFVADFYCHDAKLVVELDGKVHESQKEYDALREFIIKELGFNVIRFTNAEVENYPDFVIKKIITILL